MRQSVAQRSSAGVILLAAGLLAAWWVGNLFAQAQRSHEESARLAVLADRLDTARDLHDTVAHTLSLLSWRAQRAQLRGQAEPEDLDFFVRASAQSVQELRALMTLLRTDEAIVRPGHHLAAASSSPTCSTRLRPGSAGRASGHGDGRG